MMKRPEYKLALTFEETLLKQLSSMTGALWTLPMPIS